MYNRAMVYPVERVVINCGFGVRGPWAAGYHPGIDYDANVGTPLFATKSGRVQFVGMYGGWGQDYGYHVIIRSWHGYRFIDHIYAHCSAYSVRVGQKVATGERIATSGNSGNTTGPHLHYEERHYPYGYFNHHNPLLPYWAKPVPKPWIRLRKLKPGMKNLQIAKLKRALNKEFPKMTPLKGRAWTQDLQNRYKLYQERLGYKGKQADGIPGKSSLEKLGFRVRLK